MAENVKVEIDLAAGKLSLECPESSVDTILTRLADFLPKFREQAQPVAGRVSHHVPRQEVDELVSKRGASTGGGAVENGANKRGSAAARTGAASEARPEVQKLRLNVGDPKLLTWGSLGKDWKKYLWILEAARNQNVDGLTNGEISYLMDKTFRESRSPKVVNNLKNKIKDRFVQPLTVDVEGKPNSIWRILADGSKEVVQTAGAANA